MMKKIQMHPCWRVLIHTAQEEESIKHRAECKSASVSPIIQAKHPHALFLYENQAKRNENSRSIEQSSDLAQNR